MRTFDTLKSGLSQASRQWQMLVWLLVINLLFSLVLVLPIYSLIAGSVEDSLMAERLRDRLDGLWLADLINREEFGRTIDGIGWLFLVLPPIYLLFNTLLSGGIIAHFHRGERFQLAVFLGDCGAYFWRFVRLFLISLICYGAIAVLGFIFGAYIDSVDRWATRYTPVVYLEWGRVIVIVVLFLLVNMIFDYAKIKTITGDARGMWRQTGGALRFVFSHFLKTSGLYLIVGIIGLAITAPLLLAYSRINQTSASLLLIGFVLGQVGVLARLWARLVFYSSQLEFYKAANREPVSEDLRSQISD
jgi:hypothetical protein